MENRKKLEELLNSLGASKIGYGYLGDLLPESLKHLKSGISIAIRLSDQIINDISDKPTHTYFHHYRTVNYKIDQILLSAAMKLQDWGYLVMPIAASQSVNINGNLYQGIFPHKTAATRAGLGWIGKSGCLITHEFGPRVRLGTLLTNMELSYDEPVIESQCGSCKICVSKCPALALMGENWYPGINRESLIDPEACSNHMSNHYKHIGRGAVCGICVKNCPRGSKRIG